MTEGIPLLEKIYTLAILCLTTIYLGYNDKSIYDNEGLKIEHKYELFIIPRHTKYVEGYIVFVFPSVRPSVRLVLTFYVKILREIFLYIRKWCWPGVIRAPLGTCSSFIGITIIWPIV